MSSVTNAVSRLVFGFLYDKFGLRVLMFMVMTVNTIATIFAYTSVEVPAVYFLMV